MCIFMYVVGCINLKLSEQSIYLSIYLWESPDGVVSNVLDCDIVVSEFELNSRYYGHFRTNTLQKDMKPLIHQVWVK